MAELTNISLSRGAPSLDIIAVDDLRAAADRAFERDPAGTFAYGTSAGYPRLLEWLSKKHGVEPDRLVATNGSMQADAFLFNQLVAPGDVVVVEAPTYDRTLLSLRKLGAEILAIPLEADGIDVEALAARARGAARGRSSPTSSPTSRTRPAARSRSRSAGACSSWPREHGFTIFEDDPYVELRFEGEQHPTMLELDGATGRSSTPRRSRRRSAPASGWATWSAPADLIARDPQARPPRPTSRPTWSPRRSWPSSATRGRSTARSRPSRRRCASAATPPARRLDRHLPDARFVTPEGGYFLWVDLPEGTDVARARGAAPQERGVVFVKGTDFLLEGGESSLRLAYSAVPPDQIEEGIARVADAYRELAGAAA